MKKFYSSIILLLFPILLYSQNFKIKEKINWNNKNDLSAVAQFDNAYFLSNGIPFFYKTFDITNYNISNTHNIDIQLNDLLTTNFSNSIVSKNISKDKINPEFKIYKSNDRLYLEISFIPFININNSIERIEEFTIFVQEKNKTNPPLNSFSPSYVSNSILSSGKWVKIGIPKTGVYKLTFTQLQNLGFSNPSTVRVFNNNAGMLSYWNNEYTPDDLTENFIYKGSDYILFYAEGASIWKYNSLNSYFQRINNDCTDTAFVFLTDKNTGFSNTIPVLQQSTSAQTNINTYNYYNIHESDLINLTNSGRVWLGEEFIYNPQQSISFSIPNIKTGEQGKIIMALACRSPYTSNMSVSFADVNTSISFMPYFGYDYEKYVDYKKNTYNFTQTSQTLNFNFNFNKPTSSADAWIDYIIVNAVCNLTYTDQLIFDNIQNIGNGNASKFSISNASSSLQVWEVTNPCRPQKINYSLIGSTISYILPTDTINKYVVFNPATALNPILNGTNYGLIENQDIHSVSQQTDMLIITNKEFETQAKQIAQIHNNHDNLNCFVVTTDQIYNEFSSGMKSVPAIRNFIRMVYNKTSKKLTYVLLIGDGTFDNKGAVSSENPNFVPCYETYNSFNDSNVISFTTDDFFAYLDANEGEYSGKMDVSIGRLPVKNITEANSMVQKITAYYNNDNFADWHNIITLFTDDKDNPGDSFTLDAEDLASKIDTTVQFVNIKKIYIDAYQQITSANGQEYPDAVIDLNNRINNGTLIVNYLGHGSETKLTSEGVINNTSINKWTNLQKLALFITGTCEFSRFDNAYETDPTSTGEKVILLNTGGAIAMITTARVTYSYSNLYLNQNFYNYLFETQNGKYLTIGDAYKISKNLMSGYLGHIFVLLGDPAIRLNYPTKKIIIDKINNIDANSFSDTVKALDKISISGFVADTNGSLLSDFNGKIVVSLFDKKVNLQTLNNDGNGAMEFWNQFNILFKGLASVNNGLFNVTFTVPKDIYYNYGKAKISVYAYNNELQATGYNKNIILGGISNNSKNDTIPPEIKLYINDSLFVNGGISNMNPFVYAVLKDSSGINLSSSAIGHDITVTLDNNSKNIYSLNEYYQTYLNDFTKGSVKYQLFNIPEGNHTIKLKAFDIYNNSSDKTIDFVVVQNNELIISHLLNYPNPFTTRTAFYFEHNMPNTNFDVLLQIMTISGKIVKTIHTTMNTEGFRSVPVEWDGKDDFGSSIGRGVYIYSLKIRIPNGKVYQKYEKLLILK